MGKSVLLVLRLLAQAHLPLNHAMGRDVHPAQLVHLVRRQAHQQQSLVTERVAHPVQPVHPARLAHPARLVHLAHPVHLARPVHLVHRPRARLQRNHAMERGAHQAHQAAQPRLVRHPQHQLVLQSQAQVPLQQNHAMERGVLPAHQVAHSHHHRLVLNHAMEKGVLPAHRVAHPRRRRLALNLATEKGAPLVLLPRAHLLQSRAMVKDAHLAPQAAQQRHAQHRQHLQVPQPRSVMESIARHQKALRAASPPLLRQLVLSLVMGKDVQQVPQLRYHRRVARARRARHQRVHRLLSATVSTVTQPRKAQLPPARHIAPSLATGKGVHRAPQPLFLHPAVQVPLAQQRQARLPRSAMVNTVTLHLRALLQLAHPPPRLLQALLLCVMESTALPNPTRPKHTHHIQVQARAPHAHQ